MTRKIKTVRYESPFTSPAYMRRDDAKRYLEYDLDLYRRLVDVGAGDGLFVPFIEG